MQIAGSLRGSSRRRCSRRPTAAPRRGARGAARRRDLNLIRQGKVEQIYTIMQTGTAQKACRRRAGLAELSDRRDHARDCALALEPPGPAARSARTRGLRHERRVCGARRIQAPPLGGGLRLAEGYPWTSSRSGRRRFLRAAQAACPRADRDRPDRAAAGRAQRTAAVDLEEGDLFVTPQAAGRPAGRRGRGTAGRAVRSARPRRGLCIALVPPAPGAARDSAARARGRTCAGTVRRDDRAVRRSDHDARARTRARIRRHLRSPAGRFPHLRAGSSAPVVVHPPFRPPRSRRSPQSRRAGREEEGKDDDGRVPFYCRELSLGRKQKTDQPPSPDAEKKRRKREEGEDAARALPAPRSRACPPVAVGKPPSASSA